MQRAVCRVFALATSDFIETAPVMENTSCYLRFAPSSIMPYPLRISYCPCSLTLSRARKLEILTNAMLLEQSNCLELGPMIRCYCSFPMRILTRPLHIPFCSIDRGQDHRKRKEKKRNRKTRFGFHFTFFIIIDLLFPLQNKFNTIEFGGFP